MPQDIFEVTVLYFAKWKTISPEQYETLKIDIYKDNISLYKGDNLWLTQSEKLVDYVINLCRTLGATDVGRSIAVAAEFRQELDENLEPLSGVRKRFRGAIFTKSHPAPDSRPSVAMVNLKRMYLLMATRGFIHK